MSGIVLSIRFARIWLSLQSTADLLSHHPEPACDRQEGQYGPRQPTNFFTAAGLDARASDINNLLDGIGNGVQILQAANTGITSLNKLVDTTKSIANQALQTRGRLLHQVERLHHDRRRHGRRSARHHQLHQHSGQQQRAVFGRRRRHDGR